MCSSLSEKFYVILKLEDCLSSGLFNSLCVGGFKFFMGSKGNKVSDYICYASNRQCALPSLDVFQAKLFEMMPWLKDFIKVNVAPHGYTLSLCRNVCFVSGLKDVKLLGREYGFNNIFTNEVFVFSMSEMKKNSPESITKLRLKLVKQLLENVVVACGGVLELDKENKKEVVKFQITDNGSENEYVKILVGPVITDTPDLCINEYKRIRMEDISALCDHKFDDINGSEDQDELLNGSIVFDLLQCSIQRSVTLNLCEKDIDKRTSCKGSIFVLYNYARLYSLCARFDEEVIGGNYPELPDLENIDFSLLISDDEWQLMLESILCWPSVVKKSIIDIKEGRPRLYLIFDFLKKIASNFSRYYHRTRVLMEPRNHLIPVLFARMHLLKSLLQVYKNAFQLINLTPLQKM